MDFKCKSKALMIYWQDLDTLLGYFTDPISLLPDYVFKGPQKFFGTRSVINEKDKANYLGDR